MIETRLASRIALKTTEAEEFTAVVPPLGGSGTVPDAVGAAAFADLLTRNGSVVLADDVYVCMESRAEILAFMAEAYQHSYERPGLAGAPLDIRYIDGHTPAMIT